MGADLGETGIPVEFVRNNNPKVAGYVREIFYVRYIDWYAYICANRYSKGSSELT